MRSPVSAADGLATSVVDRGVLRRWRAAELQHPGVIARVGDDPLAHRQAHPPLVAEVEDVADPLTDADAEFGDRDVRCRDAGVRRGIRASSARFVVAEEAAVEPERVQVVVPPPECLLDRVVQRRQRLALEHRQPGADAARVDEHGVEHERGVPRRGRGARRPGSAASRRPAGRELERQRRSGGGRRSEPVALGEPQQRLQVAAQVAGSIRAPPVSLQPSFRSSDATRRQLLVRERAELVQHALDPPHA